MIVLATIIVTGTFQAIHEVQTNNQQLHLREIKLRNTQAELEQLDQDYRLLEENHSATQEEIDRLKARESELQRQLEARRLIKEQKAVAYAEAAKPRPAGSWVAQCHSWASQAGISLPDAAIKLIDRESDCNPCVISGGVIDCGYRGSKAYGIGQALPSTKTGCGSEPVCQVKWMYSYVMGRYGSWEAALAHSYANNWY